MKKVCKLTEAGVDTTTRPAASADAETCANCTQAFRYPQEIFRCTDCTRPFHRECARVHFQQSSHGDPDVRRRGRVIYLDVVLPAATPRKRNQKPVPTVRDRMAMSGIMALLTSYRAKGAIVAIQGEHGAFLAETLKLTRRRIPHRRGRRFLKDTALSIFRMAES